MHNGNNVEFDPWNEMTLNFDMELYEALLKHVLAGVNSCMVSTYGGLQLAATPTIHYYLNPTILEIDDAIIDMGKKGSGVNNGGRKLKSIIDGAGNATVVSRSSIDGAANGDCEDVLGGLTKDERNAIMDAIMALCGKLLDATSDNEYSPKGTSSAIPKKGIANFHHLESKNMCDCVDLSIPRKIVEETMNTRLFKEKLTRVSVWVKLHDVPIKVFSGDGISLIATQIGNSIMLDSFTSSMCIDSWGRSSFVRCLIEVRADAALKDSVTMGIPLPDGEGFTTKTVQVNGQQRKSGKTGSTINNRSGAAGGKATWQSIKQKVSYEMKAHGNLPMNRAPKVSSSTKDDPSKKLPTLKGGIHVPTSNPSVSTSNLYDVLDDMESDEESEVVYDEIVIFKDTRTRAILSMAPDGSNT
nr:zinc knuckle CX2CX4HX4C [Tanacetum cinerariifolium]